MPDSSISDDLPYLVVGHRGFPQRFPENSPTGLIAAAKAGAHAVELDVQVSADGVPVVIHDQTLARVSERDGFVWDYPLAELVNISVHEPARFAGQFAPTPIASLASVCDALSGFRIPVFVELKSESIAWRGTEVFVADVLAAVKPLGNMAKLISFDANCLVCVREQAGNRVEIGWVLSSIDDASHQYARELVPDVLITDVKKLSGGADIWPGDWSWFVYDIVDPDLARLWASRGVRYIETWDCRALLADLKCAHEL